jgi:hypothetical protein
MDVKMKIFLNEFIDTNTTLLIILIVFLSGFLLGYVFSEKNPIIVPDLPKQNQYLCLELTDCKYIENYLNEGYYSFCLDNQCYSDEVEPCGQMCEYEPKIF